MMPHQPARPHRPATGEAMSRLAIDEFLLLASAHTNLLLEGQEPRLEAVLTVLTPSLSRPVTTWSQGTLSPGEGRGTLIVPRVDRLDGDQQRQLVHWLEKTGGTARVIATTSVPLFALVQRGTFLDRLYYLLNIIRLELPA
jgi:hypothetical protein